MAIWEWNHSHWPDLSVCYGEIATSPETTSVICYRLCTMRFAHGGLPTYRRFVYDHTTRSWGLWQAGSAVIDKRNWINHYNCIVCMRIVVSTRSFKYWGIFVHVHTLAIEHICKNLLSKRQVQKRMRSAFEMTLLQSNRITMINCATGKNMNRPFSSAVPTNNHRNIFHPFRPIADESKLK